MTDHPLICTLRSPAELRAYAGGMRRALEVGGSYLSGLLRDVMLHEARTADGLADVQEMPRPATDWRSVVPAAPLAGPPPAPTEAAAEMAGASQSPAGAPGGIMLVWTPERIALLDEGYAEGEARDRHALRSKINALPGPACSSTDAMHAKAVKLGFTKRRREAEPSPALPPALTATTPPPIPEEDIPEARQMILAGHGAKDLVEEFGWDLSAAQNFAERVRAELEASA